MSLSETASEEGSLAVAEKDLEFDEKGMPDRECMYAFVGDAITSNDGDIIRIYFNNCNGLQINRLINTQVGEKLRKKKDQYLGEGQ